MCGIAGTISPLSPESLQAIVHSMNEAMVHRGPDAEGISVEKLGAKNLALGHRRLSILDLSPLGAQPMESARYLLVFNGEIYNHLQLREELARAGVSFRGRSDTETMLAAFEHWGFRSGLEKLAGMFAFALWDKKEQRLYLARDRMGEKPLYYGRAGESFLFSSELGSLRRHPHFLAETDPLSLELMLQFGYVPAPRSIYKNISKLRPAHFLTVDRNGHASDPQPYWNLAKVASQGISEPLSYSEASAAVGRLLSSVVKEQLVADVPVGAFLSGGIDSSLISALAAAGHPEKLRTFSIGFDQPGYDESPFAEEVAAAIGSEHTTLRMSGRQALEAVPGLSALYDEPFGDASALPTTLLCQLTRRHVKVALSGDGGDEAFGGYNRYLFGPRLQKLASPFPGFLRKGLAGLAESAAGSRWISLLPFPQPEEKARKVAAAFRAPNLPELYSRLMSQGLGRGKSLETGEAWSLPSFTPMQLLDQQIYLPDDILVKVDRASMASSLELRAPFVDHRVIELAWRLPLSWRVQQGRGKVLLRELLKERLPSVDFARPKAGFTPPVGEWLKGPLREWAEDLLQPSSLENNGIPLETRKAWERHLRDPRSSGLHLWPVLMAQAWFRSSR